MKKTTLWTFGLLFLFVTIVGIQRIRTKEIPKALSKHYFDNSIGISTLGKKFVLHRHVDREVRTIARKLITQRRNEWKTQQSSLIPNHIHQIWMEDSPLPDDLARMSTMLRKKHPGHLYTLWTPQKFTNLLSPILDHSWQSYPKEIIQDLVAAIVLWQHGGVVIDLDMECVQPLTPLFTLADFITGLEPPLASRMQKRRLLLSPSVVAATPTHFLTQHWITSIVTHLSKTAANKQITPGISQLLFTSALCSRAVQQGKPLFVGPAFFCPICPQHIQIFRRKLDGTVRLSFKQKWTRLFGLAPPFSTIHSSTYCIHMQGGRQAQYSSEKE